MIITLVFSCLLLGCGKNESENESESKPENNSEIPNYRVDDVLYPKDAKLKHVYHQGRFYAEYKYDNLNRISRIDYGADIYAYEIYQYNTKGELEKTSLYNLENQHVLRHTVFYSYDAKGNKVKEQREFTDERQTVYDLYQYNNEQLVKQEHFEGNKQTFYRIYEYKGDKLAKVKFYVPGEKDFVTTEYFYEEGLLVYTYAGYQDEKNYYDRNDNLIRTVANQPWLSSTLGATEFYVTWEYEYE